LLVVTCLSRNLLSTMVCIAFGTLVIFGGLKIFVEKINDHKTDSYILCLTIVIEVQVSGKMLGCRTENFMLILVIICEYQ
jgi:hypothetical protein